MAEASEKSPPEGCRAEEAAVCKEQGGGGAGGQNDVGGEKLRLWGETPRRITVTGGSATIVNRSWTGPDWFRFSSQPGCH